MKKNTFYQIYLIPKYKTDLAVILLFKPDETYKVTFNEESIIFFVEESYYFDFLITAKEKLYKDYYEKVTMYFNVKEERESKNFSFNLFGIHPISSLAFLVDTELDETKYILNFVFQFSQINPVFIHRSDLKRIKTFKELAKVIISELKKDILARIESHPEVLKAYSIEKSKLILILNKLEELTEKIKF